MARQTNSHARPQKNQAVSTKAPRMLALIVLLTGAFTLFHELFGTTQPPDQPTPPSTQPATAEQPQPYAVGPSSAPSTATLPITPTVPPTVLPIGIVAGHWGNDSGATCDDWLREVDINLEIARRVVYAMRALGYPTDLLEEFDLQLEAYQARALISIHSDACLYPEATGFKVARVEDSAVPQLEDELVDCLARHYQARTELPFHEGSITPDMTHYHTFYEIDPETPGAIIEIGFMLADRDLLLNRQDLVAQGIVEGILCFLQNDDQ